MRPLQKSYLMLLIRCLDTFKYYEVQSIIKSIKIGELKRGVKMEELLKLLEECMKQEERKEDSIDGMKKLSMIIDILAKPGTNVIEELSIAQTVLVGAIINIMEYVDDDKQNEFIDDILGKVKMVVELR